MPSSALNITSKQQLMLDPRIVAKRSNVMNCMSQAHKMGRIMTTDKRVRNKCYLAGATVTWDQTLQKVRLDYILLTPNKDNKYQGLAHSSDGQHFQTPEANMLQVIDPTLKPSLRIARDFAACPRMLKACRTNGPVTMNGKPSGPKWQKAPTTKRFLHSRAGMISAFGTKVRVLYDDQAIYVGFECPGKRKWDKKMAAQDYQRVEHLEVIIDPTCGRKDSYYFAVGCYGQKSQDGLATGKHPLGESWKEKWQFSISRRANGWSAIFKIPFAVLNFPQDQPGCAWGFNVCHNVPYEESTTCWTNWAGCDLHRLPEKMGVLVFDEVQFKAKHQQVWKEVTGTQTPTPLLSSTDLCVFYDPNGSKAERYKMIWSEGSYLHAAVSADGLNFKTITTVVDNGNLDTSNVAMWDPLTKRYLIYTRWWFRKGDDPNLFGKGTLSYRGVAMTASANWAGPWPDRQVVMNPRKYPGFEKAERDFYVPGVFVYENLYLALTAVYYRNIEYGPLAPSLLVSADGLHWQLVGDGVPFIERSPGQWDSGIIGASTPPIAFGDKLYFYYAARNVQHHMDKETKVQPDSGIGLACIPRDRFLCYYAHTEFPGEVLTNPLVFKEGQRLYVNGLSTSEKGELRVEVVGQERFQTQKCRPIKGDHLKAAVKWEGASFAQLKGKPFRLRFHLKGFRLYAFEVK